jgi:Flp pilus assembly pilin Flp
VRRKGQYGADRGAAAVEAGLLLAGIAAAVIGGLTVLSGDIQALLQSAVDALGRG